MKIPLSWLREFVDFDLEPEALAERLTLLGMEVQGIERRGDEWRSVVVGELLAVERHPSADRLSLTKVRVDGMGAPLAIVCGATNIAPGQRVPVALPGAVLPGNREIGVSRIAGAESHGMLCSGDELRLTSDADGILILPPESPLGRPLAELYGDVVLDVDVKPNRGDALSILGLAREVSAATGAPLRPPSVAVPETGDSTADHVSVDVREPDLCPRFVARWVDGVRVGESPLHVQLRLTAAGMRPVSNVVDATNYVMLELGKPIHAFDAGAVGKGRIVVRRATDGERLETLDHVARTLSPEVLVIADPERALGIAGVMGGADSEVGPATSAVIVESAIFDPVSIRRTAQRFGLRSEASLRFEKGQEFGLARLGAERTAQLLAEWAGGRPAVGAVDTNPTEPPLARVPFRPSRVSRLLGVAVPADDARALLARVQIETEPATTGERIRITPDATAPISENGDAVVAVIPAHRRDLEIEADVIEEIARVRGYETVPARRPDTLMPPYRPDPRRVEDEARVLLAGRGLSEIVAPALVAPGDHAALGIPPDDPATIGIANPVSADHSQLRRTLLTGLLAVLGANERQRRDDVALFEVGNVHRWRDGGPEETRRLGVLAVGAWEPAAWDRPAQRVELGDLKGLVEWLSARLRAGQVRYEAGEPWAGVEHPGRSAAVRLEGREDALGRIGELHPSLIARLGLRSERVVYAELDLAPLAAAATANLAPRVAPVPRHPGVERDLAVVVPERTAAEEVRAAIVAAGGPLLRSVSLFDRYAGAPLGDDEVSLAFRLRFVAHERTLTEAEVDEHVAAVVAAIRSHGGRIRE